MLGSKTLKNLLAAGGPEVWGPIVARAAAVAPRVRKFAPTVTIKRASPFEKPAETRSREAEARDRMMAEKPWLALTTLNTHCVHCRDAKPKGVHARSTASRSAALAPTKRPD